MYGAAEPGAVLGRFAGVRGVKRCVVKGSVGQAWRERIQRSAVRPVKARGEERDGCLFCGCARGKGGMEDEDEEEPDWDWGVVEKEMFGGQRTYELWEHGGR